VRRHPVSIRRAPTARWTNRQETRTVAPIRVRDMLKLIVGLMVAMTVLTLAGFLLYAS
jgi:hypothetical protein